MKNTMKKTLCLILATVMLVSIVPVSYAEGDTYQVGDIIQFGQYPQTEVTDRAITDILNSQVPAWNNWTSYGYYSGNGNIGSMTSGDWMRYTDIVYNGTKYRAVKFTQYRPINTFSSFNATAEKDSNYKVNTIYWFKFEPVYWRVLNPETGLVICKTIIDSQPYNNEVYYDDGENDNKYTYFNASDKYASDYETSSIRKWLNIEFYNTAFSADEQNEIITTHLNNDGYLTSTNIAGYENLDSAETDDKVFLLSFNEVTNSEYGFDSDVIRLLHGSDYAKSQGLYVFDDDNVTHDESARWLLRTPGDFSGVSCGVSYYGFAVQNYSVSNTNFGICPALTLNQGSESVIKHEHSYTEFTVSPTCSDKGYTSFVCDCNASYVDNYTDIVDHKDSDKNYKCDFGCGYKFYNPADDCSCNCHAGGLKGFFFKILNFFQKLFGQNKVCACGINH